MHITTVARLVAEHAGFTEGSVRWDVFNADTNGLTESGAILRKGRRVYIVEERYLEWLGVRESEEQAA